jgi:two-component system sensor histidine kinase PilS (NtrC family)
MGGTIVAMSTARSIRTDILSARRPGFVGDEAAKNESFWRSLRYFSYYRLIVAGVFLATILLSDGDLAVGTQDPRLFFWTCIAYLILGGSFLALLKRWKHAFDLQLTLQVAADVLILTLLLFASGGAKSGLAMMQLVVLVGAGLVGQGRMVLFYAALATMALLLEQSYRVLGLHSEIGDFFRTGLTSIGFFGSAIAARLLARRVVMNENLARRRGIELADQMRINERVIRDMQDGVLVVDGDGRVRLSNPQAAILLGLSFPLPPLLPACLPALGVEYFARRSRGVESETVLRVPDTGRSLRVRFLPPGEGGNAVLFLEDIGRLQQEAQQLKLAALGRLTANLAHEIRNPLAAISHAAELLNDELTNPGTERLLRIIGDNTQRLNRLVGEVVELGRRDRASPERINLADFLPQLLDELGLRVPDSVARIRLELPGEAVVCFDRGHLHRVVANLLDNALRHASTAAGAVRLVVQPGRTPDRLALHVIDDGPGIAAEVRNQIFEPFFTTRSSGTGLGLYIARELCEANGARLALLENAPGAHFCLSCVLSCQDRNPEPAESRA